MGLMRPFVGERDGEARKKTCSGALSQVASITGCDDDGEPLWLWVKSVRLQVLSGRLTKFPTIRL